MTMPIDLVLVRHGESEGNIANKRSYEGDHSAFDQEFKKRHSSQWRLTDLGRAQAKHAGAWIRTNINGGLFDRHYSSEYLRAMETAALLELYEANWYLDFYLRERDQGTLDVMSQEERLIRYAEELARRSRDGFFYAPPGGESMAQLCLRIDRVLSTLHRECSDKRVIIVCHGEVMLAFRVRLERIDQEYYRQMRSSENPLDKIHNGQIIHYTRRDPYNGRLSSHLDWFCSVCPWDKNLSSNIWQKIQRITYSSTDLLAIAERTPRLVS